MPGVPFSSTWENDKYTMERVWVKTVVVNDDVEDEATEEEIEKCMFGGEEGE